MTGTQIRQRAEKYLDDNITDELALEAINEALDKLSDMGLVYAETTITAAAAKTWYALPADLTALVDVTDSNGDTYTEFEQRGQSIRFGDAGTYTVAYRQHPAAMTVITNTPAVHVSYHDVLCTYLKAWYQLRDDKESPDGLRLMAQFERDAVKVFSVLRRRRRPGRIFVDRAAVIG